MAIYLVTFKKTVQVFVDAEDDGDLIDALNGMLDDVDGMEEFAQDHHAKWGTAYRTAKPEEYAGARPLKIDPT